MKKLLGAVALLALLSGSVTAAETSFTYSGIYKSLKTAQQSGFSQLSLNFYLRQTGSNKTCPTERVYLADGENQYTLSVTESGQLLLPLDKKLKQDHAAITLVTKEPVACHLAMEIAVVEFELAQLSKHNVQSWLSQFNAMYEKLAGWPGKYFMPEIVGLTFELGHQKNSEAYFISNGKQQALALDARKNYVLMVDKLSMLPNDGHFDFGVAVVKVTPILAK